MCVLWSSGYFLAIQSLSLLLVPVIEKQRQPEQMSMAVLPIKLYSQKQLGARFPCRLWVALGPLHLMLAFVCVVLLRETPSPPRATS